MEIPQTEILKDMPEAGRQLKKKIGKAKAAPEAQAQQSTVTNEISEKAKPKATATPRADNKTTSKIFDMLEQASNYKQLKKGVNEVMKMLAKHKVEAVIMAADTDPLEMLMSLPAMCEEHSVPYCFVESTAALGRACGIQR
jgi:U4/U6 small nuclear ribonucleoprotein SNU13